MLKTLVVVPVYKEIPDLIDRTSYSRLIEVCRHDICLACPEGFDANEYLKYKEVEIRFFDKKYFKGTKSYSQMLLSKEFYQEFKDRGYDYILIYQTDCWMFADKIDEWTEKGYDYIGAPIVSNHYVWKTCPAVGNGGLSLRRLDAFIEMTDPDGDILKRHGEFLKPEEAGIEDLYFCEKMYSVHDYKKPRCAEAAFFASDMNPDLVDAKYLHGALPDIGCHAWDKNIWYWRKRIKEFGNPELLALCDSKWEPEQENLVYKYYRQMKAAYK